MNSPYGYSGPSPYPVVLSFAASDPSCGAGIQADVMTLAALRCYPLTVLTGITVQDTSGVSAISPVDAEWVVAQARTLLADIAVSAFKVGVIGSRANIEAIAAIVADYPELPLVLDPVLASGRGDTLADSDIETALHEKLFPYVTLLTPNSIEARRLAANGEASLAMCAENLLGYGCKYVLITGTHEEPEKSPYVSNRLYGREGLLRCDEWRRLPGDFHGSGCTLASAVAAGLAWGKDMVDAVVDAQEYTWQTLNAGFSPGKGQGVPDRFFRARTHESE